MSDLVATMTQVRGTSTSEGVARDHRVLIDRPTAKGGLDQGPMGGVIRSTVWIGPDGTARKHWKRVTDAAKHPAQGLEAVHGAARAGPPLADAVC